MEEVKQVVADRLFSFLEGEPKMTRVFAYWASLCCFLSACSPASPSVVEADVEEGTDSTQAEQDTPKQTKKKKPAAGASSEGSEEGVAMADSGTSSCSPADCGDPAKLECVDGKCVERAIWGELEVVWGDKSQDVYDKNSEFVDAFYYGGDSGGPRYCLLRLGDDVRLWQVYVGQDATLGAQVKGTFPFREDGKSRFGVTLSAKGGTWEIATGTANLSTLQLKSGGRVEGTMEGTLRPYGSDPYDNKGPGTAQFKLRFGAVLQ